MLTFVKHLSEQGSPSGYASTKAVFLCSDQPRRPLIGPWQSSGSGVFLALAALSESFGTSACSGAEEVLDGRDGFEEEISVWNTVRPQHQ